MYDVIIIGAGPAGISASLYAKRANLNVLVLYYGKSNLEQAKKIDNYYGFPGGISGKELYNQGIEQAKKLGVKVLEKEVVKIQKQSEGLVVSTTDETYDSKTLILSTGNKKLKPNIKGVDEFEGKGISYCAICDAFFYRNKNVAIIGDGEFAISEADELSHVAKNVTILTNGESKLDCKFEVITNRIKQIAGEKKVNKVEFEDGTSLDVDGVFIALGEAGAGDFAKTMGIIQDGDAIKVDEKMQTNIDGVYACGNATGGLLQICKAVHEGAVAGLEAINFVRRK